MHSDPPTPQAPRLSEVNLLEFRVNVTRFAELELERLRQLVDSSTGREKERYVCERIMLLSTQDEVLRIHALELFEYGQRCADLYVISTQVNLGTADLVCETIMREPLVARLGFNHCLRQHGIALRVRYAESVMSNARTRSDIPLETRAFTRHV